MGRHFNVTPAAGDDDDDDDDGEWPTDAIPVTGHVDSLTDWPTAPASSYSAAHRRLSLSSLIRRQNTSQWRHGDVMAPSFGNL